MILRFFLTFGRFEPCDSYKLYSYKKESVYPVNCFQQEARTSRFGAKPPAPQFPSFFVDLDLLLRVKWTEARVNRGIGDTDRNYVCWERKGNRMVEEGS